MKRHFYAFSSFPHGLSLPSSTVSLVVLSRLYVAGHKCDVTFQALGDDRAPCWLCDLCLQAPGFAYLLLALPNSSQDPCVVFPGFQVRRRNVPV